MPLVRIVPKNETIQRVLAGKMGEIRPSLKSVICTISGFPEHDVIVSLVRPETVDPDPYEADFVVFADTCPHEGLEANANQLCTQMAQKLIDLGFTYLSFEVWLRFLPGPWCLVGDGKILDTVSHPRSVTNEPKG